MTNLTTNEPLRVRMSGNTAYIDLPLSQAQQVHELLEKHGLKHWVTETAISFDGGPYKSCIYLYYETDPNAVQAILDSASA